MDGMINYRLTVQYDGTRYHGWQKQGNVGQTIQGKLEAVLSGLADGPVEVHGSGRTDAGVHAIAQVANVRLSGGRRDTGMMKDYLNRYLPEDIAVVEVSVAPDRFHSRLNAVSKTYTYYIETSPKKPVFRRKYCYGLGKRLDTQSMRLAASCLTGTHDFKSFCGNRKVKKSTVRRIHSIAIVERGSQVAMEFIGDGFLQNMVRIMAGTLIEVGLCQRTPESMARILKSEDRSEAGFMAPPEGLFLSHVEYDSAKAGKHDIDGYDGRPGYDGIFSQDIYQGL